MKNKFLLLIVFSLIFMNACQNNKDISSNTINVNKQDLSKVSGDFKEINIIAKNFVFDPNIILVNKNDKVRLIVKSIDVTHGLAIPAYNINTNLEPGKTITVEFLADKTGEFDFFCSVFCGSGHREMKGKLIVK